MVYAGCGNKHAGHLRDHGHGRMVSGQWRTPSSGVPYALDNGAWTAHRQSERQGRKVPWDADTFIRMLSQVPQHNPPDFVILPDIVRGGRRSLTRSMRWLRVLPRRFPYYLAVQDGVNARHVDKWLSDAIGFFAVRGDHAPPIAGIFVGGSKKWKLAKAEYWVKYAHDRGLKCHIGRMGLVPDIAFAIRIGADSIDSTAWAKTGGNGRPNRFHRIQAARHQRLLEVTHAGG